MENSVNTIASENESKKHFLLVAIGASAGGLEAVKELLFHLPSSTGMAYVFVQHLDPTHESKLPELLSKVTKMPVLEANNLQPVEPDHFYIIPPNREMSLIDGMLKVTPRPSRPYAHTPINQFFMSLAENYKETAIGIILSGSATDGVKGLMAIKMAGGITFAQDETAKFESMPKSAIAEGAVDLVLSPKEMAEELEKIGKQKELYYAAIQELNEESISNRDEDLVHILQLLYQTVDVDFGQYKMSTIKRRILRRMILYKLETLKEYLHYLKHHATEVNLLYQDLLINVTSFFRDRDSAEYLKNTLLPSIIKSKAPAEPIRIWVPACSTGQEAYTLAILLVEVLAEKAATTPIQIFATDISETAIKKARLGVYSKNDVQDISPKRLQRFFIKMDGSYRIIKSIRDMCVFATHNIAKDPPFSRLDLISCCNLLIYLENHLQKKLIGTFHYALNNNGYLILGRSETVGTSAYLFSLLDKKHKIYVKKKDATAKAMFEMNYRLPYHTEEKGNRVAGSKAQPIKNKADEVDLEKSVDNLLLKKYTPASVLVNSELDILQFRGSTGLFLEPLPGKASLNLLKMAKPGLGFELRNIVHKAKKSGETVKKTGLEILHLEKMHRVSIEAVPVKTSLEEEYFLVIFEEVPVPAEMQTGFLKDKHVGQLETELSTLREDMRSIVEAQEAANEELQSANEEIVSSNEELQSINEELETSKEEIESSNEELITINQELQVRNEQLAEAQEYSEAVFTTMRECLLILDKDLRVKTANRTFYKTFYLNEEGTEGRLVFDLGNREWDIQPLRELLEVDIHKHEQIKGYEINHHFSEAGEKILLLNVSKIDQKSQAKHLVLLAIEDITEHRQGQRIIAEREAWFRNMADNAPVLIWVTGEDKAGSFFNKTWLDYRGLKPEEAIGKSWTEGVHPDDLAHCLEMYNKCFAVKKPFELKHRLKDRHGEYKLMLNKAKPSYSYEGKFTGFIGTCVEIYE